MSTESAKKLRTSSGLELAYHLRGARGSGPGIVLIHSLGLGGFVWDAVAERLAPHLPVLTYDARGHGASAKPSGPYSSVQFADDLAGLLDALGWTSAHVAGCSMGGCVALQFAVDRPDRVRSLALVDTTAWYGEDARKSWDERAERARMHGLASMIAFQETRWFSDAFRAAHPEVVARSREAFLANDLDAYAATCMMLGRFDLRARLGTVAAPTAVAVGEEDYATPVEMARELHDGIARSTLDVIAPGRHLTPLERPDALADVLRGVLDRAARKESSGITP